MGIKKINHIAINSRSIEASKHFYCDILGLKEGKMVDMGADVLHYILLPDGASVELFEIKEETHLEIEIYENAIKHLAFEVDGIEEMDQRLKSCGVIYEMELCVLEPLKVKALLCKDPDGVIVELSQYI